MSMMRCHDNRGGHVSVRAQSMPFQKPGFCLGWSYGWSEPAAQPLRFMLDFADATGLRISDIVDPGRRRGPQGRQGGAAADGPGRPRSLPRSTAAARAAFEMASIHATHLLEGGAELTTVRDNLQHVSLATTSLYLHADDARRAKQVAVRFAVPRP